MEVLKLILTTCGAAIVSGLVSLGIASINAKKEKAAAEAAAKERKEQEDNEAKTDEARLRVLRFGDEVRRGVLHTEEHWADILRDIDRYEDYCDKHPDYENNRATRTIKFLKDTFDARLKKNDFLK